MKSPVPKFTEMLLVGAALITLRADREVDGHDEGGADMSLARPGRKQATSTKIARRLTCFLPASVTRKDLQFGT